MPDQISKNFSLTISSTRLSAENERVEKASKNLQVLLNQEQILHKGVKEELENLKTDRTQEYKALRFKKYKKEKFLFLWHIHSVSLFLKVYLD